MTEPVPALQPVAARADHVFPTLTPAQIARIARARAARADPRGRGARRGGRSRRAVLRRHQPARSRSSGRRGDGETLIAVHRPGQFTGEVNMLSGRRALLRARAPRATARSIELDREQLLALVQTDAELERDPDARVHPAPGRADRARPRRRRAVGSTHSPGTLRIKEFLTRNGHPYAYVDLDRDAGRPGRCSIAFTSASPTCRC